MGVVVSPTLTFVAHHLAVNLNLDQNRLDQAVLQLALAWNQVEVQEFLVFKVDVAAVEALAILF